VWVAAADGAEPVGLLDARPLAPLQLAAIGLQGGGQGGAVVATPSHQHHAQLGHLATRPYLQRRRLGVHLQRLARD